MFLNQHVLNRVSLPADDWRQHWVYIACFLGMLGVCPSSAFSTSKLILGYLSDRPCHRSFVSKISNRYPVTRLLDVTENGSTTRRCFVLLDSLPSDTNLGTLAKMHGYACQDLGKILPRSYQGYHDHARSWQG